VRGFGRVVLPPEVPWLIDQAFWVFAKVGEECFRLVSLRTRDEPVAPELLLWLGGLPKVQDLRFVVLSALKLVE
jgi:hypothetical protein